MKKVYGRLKDRVGIVTGAGGGISKEIALGMAAEGACVAVMGRRVELLNQTVKEIEAKGGKAMAVQGDVSVPEDCFRTVEETVKAFGKLDMLVHGAAIFPNTQFMDTTPEAWRKVIDINLNGTYFINRAVIPEMLKNGSGDIVNIITGFVRMGQPAYPHYCASKAGAMMITRGIAAEFGPQNIRCNGMSPGYSPDTEGSRATRDTWDDPMEAQIAAGIPLRRKIMPEEYVGPTIFLLDREESFNITGQVIAVDNGMTMI